MIDLLTTLLGIVVPGAGLWGIILKIATRLGAGWVATATSGPVLEIVAKVSGGLVDVVLWAVKGVVGYAGAFFAAGVDHITKSVPAATVLGIAVWTAYGLGADRWSFWTADPPSAAAAPTPTKNPSKSTAPARASPKASEDPFRETLCKLGGC